MRKAIGIEVGNYDTKLIVTDKKLMERIESKGGLRINYKQNDNNQDAVVLGIINAVTEIEEDTVRRHVTSSNKRKDALLDVTITTNDTEASGRYFVAGQAITGGGKVLKPTPEDRKSENPMTLVMLLSTLAYALIDENSSAKKQSATVSIGTLLPTEEYFSVDLDEYAKKLSGKHTVEFNDPAFEGKEIAITIADDVDIKPEGTAGQLAVAYDWDGEFLEEEFADETVLNIDIGSIDVDVSVMMDGEFVSHGFFGFKGGTKEVLRAAAKEIREKHDYDIDTHKLDYFVRAEKDIKVGTTKTIKAAEIKDIVAKIAKVDARSLSGEITQSLSDSGFHKNQFNKVILIGGGPGFFHAGIVDYFETETMKTTIAEHPRFKNVEGALKSILEKHRQNSVSRSEEALYEDEQQGA